MKSAFRYLALAATLAFVPLSPARAAEANPWASALGSSGAQAVFTTYMSIAELADLFGAKAYDKKKALQLASMYEKLTEGAKESLTDLVSSGKLNKDDEAAVQQMVVINDLLGKTAKGITAYINDPTDENEQSYEKNRQKSWKALAKFLGIEDS